jgi:lipopolysaccharide/colanic/teichoic acid biosynthesis glycosyltransferase
MVADGLLAAGFFRHPDHVAASGSGLSYTALFARTVCIGTMASGWRYRIAAVGGVVGLTVAAVGVANQPVIEIVFRRLPVVGHLPLDRAHGVEFVIETGVAALVVVLALGPLHKPRPRRILDVWMLAIKRTLVALFALATIGYFDYSYRLPRATLLISGVVLLFVVPAWFVTIRQRPDEGTDGKTIIVGDDPETMAEICQSVEGGVLGYVAPPVTASEIESMRQSRQAVADGGTTDLATLPALGGLSRLGEVLVEYEVDTAVLAFRRPDRAEFFGTIGTCYEFGVAAKVHRKHAHLVLTSAVPEGKLVDVDLEPWDLQDRVVKRAFDLCFAIVGLLATLPLLVLIGAAIKLDDGGPLFYSQERTAAFGETFTVYKFRTMRVGDEDPAPSEDTDNPRITRMGRVLRQTHLDEIPQLWSILVGTMSVVGPRAAWTDEEGHIQNVAEEWRQRWFVKPGLTGLAQINQVDSTDPETKLQYDVEYIRRQSFWFELKIIVRQLWLVARDVVDLLRDRH